MTPAAWQASGDYFQFQEHSIFYKEEGSGAALCLVHGFPTASWDWWQIWSDLTKQFHVLAPDMLGFGFSDKPRPYAYSIMEQADLMEAFLLSKNIKEVHLFSHDYGVSVVQELLARTLGNKCAVKILSSCFLNGGLFMKTYRPRMIQKIMMSPIGPLLGPFLGRRNLEKTFQDIFGPDTQPSDQEMDDFWSLVNYNSGKYVLPRLIHYMKDRFKYKDRWGGQMPKSKVPMRLINGAADPISGVHVAEYYQSFIPNADVVVLDKIGHYPHSESPAQVLTHFLDFHKKLNLVP